MKRTLFLALSCMALSGLIEKASACNIGSSGVSWTCSATIALTGAVNQSYVPTPWNDSIACAFAGIVPRSTRVHDCAEDVKTNWLNNGAIWGSLGLSAAQQESVCRSGATAFRVSYEHSGGIMSDAKDYSFVGNAAAPHCTPCAQTVCTCPAGWMGDNNVIGGVVTGAGNKNCKIAVCGPIKPGAGTSPLSSGGYSGTISASGGTTFWMWGNGLVQTSPVANCVTTQLHCHF